MQSAWDKYVSDYNSTYRGSEMEREYNEEIATGNYVKYQKGAN
jgi:hypothetical protein